ncbi:protein of unknown function [Taphrina deformans PYCC 5710]|uniref:Uncharacterized protein n=1 Tax=Taphrina deformans (strain PYCC 5710 / ATCC 11124 / CBS 356.35 / IMI 108563 / JCM 9778 / NBRC 8474) TaxID=1097556 RepID=R4XBZ3_TAPDE|nr:protein of unknown function [Taphrina deformans PYCC 5710]|eukprot:CCG83392.1 protein of unknown function [Taphrina deformans PYCC 5710]
MIKAIVTALAVGLFAKNVCSGPINTNELPATTTASTEIGYSPEDANLVDKRASMVGFADIEWEFSCPKISRTKASVPITISYDGWDVSFKSPGISDWSEYSRMSPTGDTTVATIIYKKETECVKIGQFHCRLTLRAQAIATIYPWGTYVGPVNVADKSHIAPSVMEWCVTGDTCNGVKWGTPCKVHRTYA